MHALPYRTTPRVFGSVGLKVLVLVIFFLSYDLLDSCMHLTVLLLIVSLDHLD
jgi:hypothetical protein